MIQKTKHNHYPHSPINKPLPLELLTCKFHAADAPSSKRLKHSGQHLHESAWQQ